MKDFASSILWRICIWVVVFLTALPPSLLAQTIGTPGFPIPGAGFPGVTKEMMPGAPVITNPTALQPLAPPQTPCPTPPAKTPPVIAPTGPTLNDFWPADSSAVLPPSADTRIRLERDERFKKEQRDDILKQKVEREDASKLDADARSKQEREE